MHTLVSRRFPAASLRRLALFAGLAAVAAAPAATVEERLAALEKQMEELRAENAALRAGLAPAAQPAPKSAAPAGGGSAVGAPPAATNLAPTKAPVLVSPNGKEGKLVLGGFVHFNAETGGAPDARWTGIADRFYVRRARLNVTATFAEGFGARLEGAFGNNTIAAKTNYSAQATDAYVQWTQHPEFTLRGGQFKTPFGYEQIVSDLKCHFIERSLPNDRLTFGRQIGLMATGEVAAKRLVYSVGAFNGNGTNQGGNDNENFLTAGRLAAVAYDGQTAGGATVRWTAGTNALTTYDNGAFTGRKTGWGLDTQLVAGPAEVWAEWLRQDARPAAAAPFTAEGWSVLGGWLFAPHWQGVLRYETYDANTATAATTTRTWTFGLNWLIKGDDLKFSLNYLAGKQPAPAGADGRLIGRMQVVF